MVLIAARRGAVLNGRDRNLKDCLLPGLGIGGHGPGSRRQRATEDVVWRAVSITVEFER